jgi:hypothetical protein
MNAAPPSVESEKHQLLEAIEHVRCRLARAAGEDPTPENADGARDEEPTVPALERLGRLFGLTRFEKQVLLCCAGVELVSSVASICARLQGDARRTQPSFSLALSTLADPHWSAIAPQHPLRRWKLIELQPSAHLTTSALRIDETVLQYLTGVPCIDERLAPFLEPIEDNGDLGPSLRPLAERIANAWREDPTTVVQLAGTRSSYKSAVVCQACTMLGLDAYAMRAVDVSTNAIERDSFAMLWGRQAALFGAALYIDAHEVEGAERQQATRSFVKTAGAFVTLGASEPLLIPGRPVLRLDVRRPPAAEQIEWLGASDPHQETLAVLADALDNFQLDAEQVRAGLVEATERARTAGDAPGALRSAIWAVLRQLTRGKLDEIAQRIEPIATWDDIVLPPAQLETLREVGAQVRHRKRVYEEWGLGKKSSRGLGISALFSGPSGTGKTMAAEVLANEIGLDLYRIDLSQVVSKYIGETEKNLKRAFDAADAGGSILLFDEADALFGKRSESVKDSHDRYANIEVGYLLQRMEAYRGLAILTTNLKSAIDQAFMRRIRFAIQFPFPDVGQRAEIWRRVFPARTPTDGLRPERLAQLHASGGNIQNIAMNAAFLAASLGEPVRMGHLLRAARSEYAKQEKSLTQAEIGGWV